MTDALKPRDGTDVEDAVRWALAEGKSLELVGHGSKRGIGRPVQTDLTLDLSGLSGVRLYEPEELVLTARAGTSMAEIEAIVVEHGQQLAFEPPDYAHILGGVAAQGTIGGVLAANLSGPRRLKAGAARDHFLGFSAVSGRGETFKSGGRVVKNVTGYDLCKLMAGSFGTLSILTEVTIKVLPRPDMETTIAIAGLSDAVAVQAMTAAVGSSCDVSGAAHLPATDSIPVAQAAAGGRSLTALRLEGFALSVRHRQAALTALLAPFGEVGAIAAPASQALWQAIREVRPFAASRSGADAALWRISTPPASGARLTQLIAGKAAAEWFYDWVGGLIWLLLSNSGDDAGAAMVRRAVAVCGGHATLVRAPAAVRAKVAPFEPERGELEQLSQRVKQAFDPKGVLNPGRMWAGV